MPRTSFLLAVLAIIAPAAASANAKVAPLPGYRILADVRLSAGKPRRTYRIVALGKLGEDVAAKTERGAPARPLLIFADRGGRPVLLARNDHVVMRADAGGQCDPFLDSDATIAVKGRLFTVENGVACGQHWTDFVTFRLDERAGFVFDNERIESWSLNPSDAPDAPAMVRDGPPEIRRATAGRIVSFATWRPRR